MLALQTSWAEQRAAETVPKIDARPADQRLDRVWAALGVRLETVAELPATVPQSAIAARQYARLFPDGLAFLKLPFDRQWAESEQRLRLIDEGATEDEIKPIVGEFLLDELREAHAQYGEVLGITSSKPPRPDASGVVEPMRAVQRAITSYTLQLIAAAEADPTLAAAVRNALRPLDDLRTAQARRAASGERQQPPISQPPTNTTEITPTTPIPEVPALTDL